MRKLIDSLSLEQSSHALSSTGQPSGRVHTSQKHESAIRQVQGSANYVDDITEPQGTLYAAIGLSQCARGKITAIDLSAVRASEGVIDVVTIDDVIAARK